MRAKALNKILMQEFFEDLDHATKPQTHRKPLQRGGLGGLPVGSLRPLLANARMKLRAVGPPCCCSKTKYLFLEPAVHQSADMACHSLKVSQAGAYQQESRMRSEDCCTQHCAACALRH